MISVRISDGKLPCLRIRVYVGLFFQLFDEAAGPFQGDFVVINAKKQKETIARCPIVRIHQGGMLVRTPLVEAEQHGSIRIEDLSPVIMAWSSLGLTEKRLIPLEATGNIAHADDRPCSFHAFGSVTSALAR